jgi:hypothetical protein
MAPDVTTPRSRRAILAAAAGAAGALAAQAALPLSAAAAPANLQTESDNPTVATTSITDSGSDSTAFASHATGTGTGYGVEATSTGGGGLFAWSMGEPSADWFEPEILKYTGVFGYSQESTEAGYAGTGVWGDSPDTGVFGSGGYGVVGYGGVGVEGDANELPGSIGVRAWAPSTAQTALKVTGKVSFSRSGRKSMAAGKSSVVVSLAGVKSSSKVFAVLATSESGRWVRAVVPAAGKFTVRLNTTLRTKAVVAWFVLD